PSQTVLEMRNARDVVRRGMEVGQLAATSGLGHNPFGIGIIVEPASVINEVAEHVRGPASSGAINRMHVSDRAAGNNFFNLFVMLAVAMLIADERFGGAFIQSLLDLQTLGAAHSDRLFKGDQFGA